jgi:hypothetical protein
MRQRGWKKKERWKQIERRNKTNKTEKEVVEVQEERRMRRRSCWTNFPSSLSPSLKNSFHKT